MLFCQFNITKVSTDKPNLKLCTKNPINTNVQIRIMPVLLYLARHYITVQGKDIYRHSAYIQSFDSYIHMSYLFGYILYVFCTVMYVYICFMKFLINKNHDLGIIIFVRKPLKYLPPSRNFIPKLLIITGYIYVH